MVINNLFISGINPKNVYDTCQWCYPFKRAITVLVASCPCALGLAIPSVVAITLNIAMKNGVLVKKNNVFEEISNV